MKFRQPLAVITLISVVGIYLVLFLRATSGLDTSWDSLSYHLPFAARLAGIVDYERLILRPIFEARYHGYPVLTELIQGYLWRLAGDISYANVLGIFSLLIINVYLALRLKLNFLRVLIGLLSVPLILIHSVSSYNDLFNNVFFAIALLQFTFAIADQNLSRRDFLLISFALALSLNSKYLLLPFILLLYLALLIFSYRKKIFNSDAKFFIYALLVSLLIFAVPLKNLACHGNPLYPLSFRVGPIAFTGVPEEFDTARESAVKSSGFIKFLKSITEYDLYTEGRKSFFSIDQSAGDAKYVSSKMGGYFVFNLILWLSVLILSINGSDRRHARLALAVFTVSGLLTASLHPGPHLRYWLFLPIFLLGASLRSAQSFDSPQLRQFVIIMQTFIFLVILRLCWNAYFDKLPTLKLAHHKITADNKNHCVVLQERKMLFMALANPDLYFTGVNHRRDCPAGSQIWTKD